MLNKSSPMQRAHMVCVSVYEIQHQAKLIYSDRSMFARARGLGGRLTSKEHKELLEQWKCSTLTGSVAT